MNPLKAIDVVAGVHKAINAVQAALAKTGIGKDRKNAMQGYNFRGIDDMYNELSPLLSENGLVVLPKYSERQVVERESAKGGALFYVTLRGEFTFLASDGSCVEVVTYGEAMDSGDKATNKAMSAALKYAFMQVFTIPTVGDNDSENQTHEVKAVKPQRFDAEGDKRSRVPTEAQDKAVADFCAAIETADTVDTLKEAWEGAYKVVSLWDLPMMVNLIEAAKNKRKRELAAKEKA